MTDFFRNWQLSFKDAKPENWVTIGSAWLEEDELRIKLNLAILPNTRLVFKKTGKTTTTSPDYLLMVQKKNIFEVEDEKVFEI